MKLRKHLLDRAAQRQPPWTAFALALAAACAWSVTAKAHPHVFITTQTSVLFENGSIVGLRHRWMFDEYYTSSAVEGLDANNDGVYDRAELAELAQATAEGLKEFSYFTQAKLANQDLGYQDAKDYWFELTEIDNPVAGANNSAVATSPDPSAETRGFWQRLWDRISSVWSSGKSAGAAQPLPAPPAKIKVLAFEFTVPLQQPVLAEAEGFQFAVQDPSVFIWFEPIKSNPVQLTGAPQGCTIKPGDGSADSEALNQAFSGAGPSSMGHGATVVCPKP